MPIYEYRCDRGHTFDVMQRMADDPLTTCTICDAPVQRVFHAPAVHFKGSGFYNTDYGKKKTGASADGSGGKSESKESASESKSESKPDSSSKSSSNAKSGDSKGSGSKSSASSGD